MKYEKEIYEVMKELGVSPDKLGYRYSCFIINEMLVDNTKSMTDFYNQAAQEYNSTYSRVERCIRHSVDVVFAHTDFEVLNKYFGNCISYNSGRLSNHSFLACVAQYIKVYKL